MGKKIIIIAVDIILLSIGILINSKGKGIMKIEFIIIFLFTFLSINIFLILGRDLIRKIIRLNKVSEEDENLIEINIKEGVGDNSNQDIVLFNKDSYDINMLKQKVNYDITKELRISLNMEGVENTKIEKYIFGRWYNVEHFLILKEDGFFEWDMPQFLGKGHYKIIFLKGGKLGIEFYFDNGEIRVWKVSFFDHLTIELESIIKYEGNLIKFLFYKNAKMLSD